MFLLVVDVDVEVVLVRCEAGPKARLLVGLPLGMITLEVGTLADELGGTGTDADSEGRILPTPKRRLEEAAGGGITGADEDGRGGVTGGGAGPAGADGDECGGVTGGGDGGTGGTEDGTLTEDEGG
jgi:hypothetical protein